ncbi:MAG TPA: hypothetical protein VLA93_10705 [Pyrinomonadaceae bacterium]|nr:hypothetical protein [Pyrinomonadaceae bacterium]
MRNNFSRRILSIVFSISVLLILGSNQRQVQAQPTESITFIYGSFGIAPNQTVRYTWLNRNDPDPLKRLFEPSRIRVRLLAGDGSVIAQQEAAAVGAGRSQSFDFDRDQISLLGEPGTGRIQARLEPTLIVVFSRTGNIANHSILNTFASDIEVFDNLSGRTTVSFGGGVNAFIVDDTPGRANFNPKAFQIISAGKNYLVGIAPDQTLRLVIALVVGEARKPPPPDVDVGAWILDSSGRVVLQSPQVQIAPNEFHIFDFNASSLPITAERGTGRKQVRLLLVANGEPANLTDLFLPSLELVGPTGRTEAKIETANNLKQIGLSAH